MADFTEREEAILVALRRLNKEAGAFATAMLTDELTREDQIAFASCLTDLAALIRDRAASSFGMVIEGSVTDDCTIAARGLSGPARDARKAALLR
jgi:hypothetical protein